MALWRMFFLATVVAAPVFHASAGDNKEPTCASIMQICLKRAGTGYAGICEDLYSQAKNTGTWPTTKDLDGKVYPAFSCKRD